MILFCVFVVYFTLREIGEISLKGWDYWRSYWSWIEWFIIELENKYKQHVWIDVNFAAPPTAQRAAPQWTPSASFDLKPTSQ